MSFKIFSVLVLILSQTEFVQGCTKWIKRYLKETLIVIIDIETKNDEFITKKIVSAQIK